MSDVVLERIAGWESAGLIDAATAERLRAAEIASDAHDGPPAAPSRAGVASSFFGPPVSIVEAFSYLGVAFVLAAWSVLIGRLNGEATGSTSEWILVVGMAVPAVVFFSIGLALHGRSPRLSRAAGVAFVVSVGLVWAGVTLNVEIFTDGAIALVAGAAAALIVALAYRWIHPAVLTEIALLATLTGLAGALVQAVDEVAGPSAGVIVGGQALDRGVAGAVIESVFWIACAVVIGLVGLAESRTPSAAAGRRASLARFWAGVVLIVGVSMALMRTEFDDDAFSYRVIEPWIAQLVVLLLSAILVQRAFRRGAGAYVLAAALGVVIALTDFNFTYFAQSSGVEVALLVEGLLLIAIAFGAERLSRRVGGDDPAPEPEPMADVPPADAEPEVPAPEQVAAAPEQVASVPPPASAPDPLPAPDPESASG